MERAKVLRRINNLKKIKEIVEIAKFDTLQKLASSEKVKDHHYDMANTCQDVLSFVKSRNRFATKLSTTVKHNIHKPTLYVFITIPSFLIKTSYANVEKKILKEINKTTDKIIIVGDRAQKFAEENKLNIHSYFEHFDGSEEKIVSVVTTEILVGKFDVIKIASKTPGRNKSIFQVYPAVVKKEENKQYKKYSFYHSLPEIVQNINDTYVENTLKGIFKETTRYYYQEKLIKHEGSLKNIDERIYKLQTNLNKIERKEETEEMIQISQLAKKKG